MTEERIGAYVGIDPTASSLHLGHLLPLMALLWMYVHGFEAVTLVSFTHPPYSPLLLTCYSLVALRAKSAIQQDDSYRDRAPTARRAGPIWLPCT